jgi:hypothetical protein
VATFVSGRVNPSFLSSSDNDDVSNANFFINPNDLLNSLAMEIPVDYTKEENEKESLTIATKDEYFNCLQTSRCQTLHGVACSVRKELCSDSTSHGFESRRRLVWEEWW